MALAATTGFAFGAALSGPPHAATKDMKASA
jgi:hypothetical protein